MKRLGEDPGPPSLPHSIHSRREKERDEHRESKQPDNEQPEGSISCRAAGQKLNRGTIHGQLLLAQSPP